MSLYIYTWTFRGTACGGGKLQMVGGICINRNYRKINFPNNEYCFQSSGMSFKELKITIIPLS